MVAMNFKDFYDLARFDHGILVVIAILVGEIITLKSFPPFYLFLKAGLTGLFIQAASFMIGDYFDRKTDMLNKRYDRPLARGTVNEKTAVLLSLLFFAVGLTLAYSINFPAFLIASVFALIGFSYGFYFKNTPLLGNFFTAASMAVPFIFGGIVHGKIPSSVIVLSAMAFLAGTGRELIKGVQDYEGDKLTGRKTFAIVFGKTKAVCLAVPFVLSAVILSFYPFFAIKEFLMDYVYLSFIVITDLLWVYAVVKAVRLSNLESVRRITMLGQFTALLGFLLGVLF